MARRTRGQQTGSQAAVLIGILALLMVFYILFLPPGERAELLGTTPPGEEDPSTPSSDGDQSQHAGERILSVSPGDVEYQSRDSYTYDMPAFTLYQTEEAVTVAEDGKFAVSKSWFGEQKKQVSFRVDDLDAIKDPALSLTLDEYEGELTITLNGREIYNYEVSGGNVGPISIEHNYLEEGENTMTLSVSGVGLRFWDTNIYGVRNLKLTATRIDDSRSGTRTSFHIASDRGENIEKAELMFYPECSDDAGKLSVYLNHERVFSGVADCGIKNSYTLSPSTLNVGKNQLQFSTQQGRYQITRPAVKTEMKELKEPTYYFDLTDELFFERKEPQQRCGEPDGHCPDGCDEDADPDCCFETYTTGYWCDTKPSHIGDRCVGNVENETCDRCPTGYEDEDGRPPEACEGMCGDDTDDRCPASCSPNRDKDCCFAQGGDQYWCDSLPVTGLEYRCVEEMTTDTCSYCLTGYEGESQSLDCGEEEEPVEREHLKSQYHINLTFKFTERGDSKEAEFFVNGYAMGFDTREDSYSRFIDDYVESGTNSLRLIPKSDLSIREITITIED